MNFVWEAVADYEDGTHIEKLFTYNENDNYSKECERQHELEEWLLQKHEGCTFYSVACVEAED